MALKRREFTRRGSDRLSHGTTGGSKGTKRLTGMSQLITIESLINQYISNQLEEKLPRVVSEQLKRIAPPPVWMTEKQLAEYWQLRTPDGEVTVHSIRKWTARPEGEYPLPCASMGEMRRYHREEVDRWAWEEAARQKNKRGGGVKTAETRVS